MRRSPAPACGSGSSTTCKTSGPPHVVTPIAFIIVSSLPLALPETQEPRREDGVPRERSAWPGWQRHSTPGEPGVVQRWRQDRKSTRLNSSHGYISYAVFCLKKKKKKECCNESVSDMIIDGEMTAP